MRIKLTWHPHSQRWTKVIGKRPSADGKRLVQAQHYFTAVRDESESLALSMKAEWSAIKRGWKASHQPYLETLDLPFAETPHWYRPSGGTAVTQEDMRAIRTESNQATADEIAYEHRDIPLSEVQALYFAERKRGEGIDFKSHSNRNHEIDVNNAMRFINGALIAADLSAEAVNAMRLKMMNPQNRRGFEADRPQLRHGVQSDVGLVLEKQSLLRSSDAQRDALDAEIEMLTKQTTAANIDPNAIVASLKDRLFHLACGLSSLPPMALKDVLTQLTSRLEADMETKQVTFAFHFPTWMLVSDSKTGIAALCTRANSEFSTGSGTHPAEGLFVTLGEGECKYVRHQRSVTCDCRRRNAA